MEVDEKVAYSPEKFFILIPASVVVGDTLRRGSRFGKLESLWGRDQGPTWAGSMRQSACMVLSHEGQFRWHLIEI